MLTLIKIKQELFVYKVLKKLGFHVLYKRVYKFVILRCIFFPRNKVIKCYLLLWWRLILRSLGI